MAGVRGVAMDGVRVATRVAVEGGVGMAAVRRGTNYEANHAASHGASRAASLGVAMFVPARVVPAMFVPARVVPAMFVPARVGAGKRGLWKAGLGTDGAALRGARRRPRIFQSSATC